MKKNPTNTSGNDDMEELKKFVTKKKEEQEALRKLLKALDKQSFEENKNTKKV